MSPGVLEKFVHRTKAGDQVGGKIPDLILEERVDLTEFKKLTPREQEILEAISQGLNNREIAQTLFISLSTIRTHISNMISSLNVENRSQLKYYADAIFEHRYKTLAK